MAKYIKQNCIHCLQYFEELTEDHIFPRSWYPESTPNNLEKWIVPSCNDCNKKLGKAEEMVFNRLIFSINEKELGALGLNKKIMKPLLTIKDNREMGRQIKLLMDAVQNFSAFPYSEDNEHVLKNFTPNDGSRSKLMIRIPTNELYIVAEKIIRGLEFRLRDRLIESDRKINIIIPGEHNKEELKYVDKWEALITPYEENAHRGPGFIVKFGVNPNDDNWVIYNVKIWNQLEIWAFISSKDRKINKQPKNKTKSNELLNKSSELSKQKRYDEALVIINDAIELDSQNFYAYLIKAEILHKLNKYEDALKAINTSIKLKPNNSQALSDKVSILGLLEKYDEAILTADEALKLNFDDNLLYRKGISLYHLKKYPESILIFDECLKINPINHLAIEYKILALIWLEKNQEAVDLFYSHDLSHRPSLENNIGRCLIQLKNYDKAEKQLKEALQHIENDSETKKYLYYNLYVLKFKTKKYIEFLYYYFLLLKEVFKFKRNEENKKNQPSRYYFKGPGTLFITNSQEREAKAIIKLFRGPNFWALCNDWFNWFAINIPLNLLGDNNFKGDIDLLVNMHIPPLSNKPGKFIYRVFEVKSALVDKLGKPKSLTESKFNTALKQLKIKRYFGCQQLFLLELYILERGFSNYNTFPTNEIIKKTKEKIKNLQKEDFGYVMFIDEPSPDFHEEAGGIMHYPINVLPTHESKPFQPFLALAEFIDNFHQQEIKKFTIPGKFTFISYCKKCKRLIMLYSDVKDLKCYYCGKLIY